MTISLKTKKYVEFSLLGLANLFFLDIYISQLLHAMVGPSCAATTADNPGLILSDNCTWTPNWANGLIFFLLISVFLTTFILGIRGSKSALLINITAVALNALAVTLNILASAFLI